MLYFRAQKQIRKKINIIYKFINCCSVGAHLRSWHIWVCITNWLLFRDILAKKNFQLSPFLLVMLNSHIGAYLANWALIWQWQMSLDVASQCKGNGLIEIYRPAEVLDGRQINFGGPPLEDKAILGWMNEIDQIVCSFPSSPCECARY